MSPDHVQLLRCADGHSESTFIRHRQPSHIVQFPQKRITCFELLKIWLSWPVDQIRVAAATLCKSYTIQYILYLKQIIATLHKTAAVTVYVLL